MKRRQKAGFLRPISSKIIVTKEKKKEKKKERGKGKDGGEKKKAMVALLVFIIAIRRLFLAGKICWTRKGPFADKVFKNPARFTYVFFNQCVNFLVGAIACLKLKKFEEAVKWCDQGLSVSFCMNLPSRS